MQIVSCSGEDLKCKWKNLRDSYQKYLRANMTTTRQSAVALKKKHLEVYKNWTWENNLEFFLETLHLSFAM